MQVKRKGQVVKLKRVSPVVEEVLRVVCRKAGLASIPRSLLWVSPPHGENDEELCCKIAQCLRD